MYGSYLRDIWIDEWVANSDCGLDKVTYKNLKNSMLKSLFMHGGFWIGQYELGCEKEITEASSNFEPVCKQDAFPYCYLSCSHALSLVSSFEGQGYTVTLPFALQWALTLKFIELHTNSTFNKIACKDGLWGNVYVSSFVVERGMYREENSDKFKKINGKYKKSANSKTLLSCGASKRNCLLNIYDLYGNMSEWILGISKAQINKNALTGGSVADGEGAWVIQGGWRDGPPDLMDGGRPVIILND